MFYQDSSSASSHSSAAAGTRIRPSPAMAAGEESVRAFTQTARRGMNDDSAGEESPYDRTFRVNATAAKLPMTVGNASPSDESGEGAGKGIVGQSGAGSPGDRVFFSSEHRGGSGSTPAIGSGRLPTMRRFSAVSSSSSSATSSAAEYMGGGRRGTRAGAAASEARDPNVVISGREDEGRPSAPLAVKRFQLESPSTDEDDDNEEEEEGHTIDTSRGQEGLGNRQPPAHAAPGYGRHHGVRVAKAGGPVSTGESDLAVSLTLDTATDEVSSVVSGMGTSTGQPQQPRQSGEAGEGRERETAAAARMPRGRPLPPPPPPPLDDSGMQVTTGTGIGSTRYGTQPADVDSLASGSDVESLSSSVSAQVQEAIEAAEQVTTTTAVSEVISGERQRLPAISPTMGPASEPRRTSLTRRAPLLAPSADDENSSSSSSSSYGHTALSSRDVAAGDAAAPEAVESATTDSHALEHSISIPPGPTTATQMDDMGSGTTAPTVEQQTAPDRQVRVHASNSDDADIKAARDAMGVERRAIGSMAVPDEDTLSHGSTSGEDVEAETVEDTAEEESSAAHRYTDDAHRIGGARPLEPLPSTGVAQSPTSFWTGVSSTTGSASPPLSTAHRDAAQHGTTPSQEGQLHGAPVPGANVLPPGCPALSTTSTDDSVSNGDVDGRETGQQDVEAAPLPSWVAPLPGVGGKVNAAAAGGGAAHALAEEEKGAPNQPPAPLHSTPRDGSSLRPPMPCSSPREYPRCNDASADGDDRHHPSDRAERGFQERLARAQAAFPLDGDDVFNKIMSNYDLIDVTASTCVGFNEQAEAMVKVLSVVGSPPVHALAAAPQDGSTIGVSTNVVNIEEMLEKRQQERLENALNGVSGPDDDEDGDDDHDNELAGSVSIWALSTMRRSRNTLQSAAQLLALEMLEAQERIAAAGLVKAHHTMGGVDEEGEEEGRLDDDDTVRTVCRGIRSLRVDSECRILAQLDVEPCAASLSDVMAFQSLPLIPVELLGILSSLTTAVAAVHSCGLAHGAVHGGNVLLSASDGHCTLTQPALVMSSYALPTDLAALAPARAWALLPLVRQLWPEVVGGSGAGGGGGKRLGQQPVPPSPEDMLTAYALELLSGNGHATGSHAARQAMSYTPTMQDDLYAIGNVALLLLLGAPVFHAARLPEVVATLVDVFPRDAAGVDRDTVCNRLFRRVTECPFVARRFELAGYTPELLKGVTEFIGDCLLAGGGCQADDGLQSAVDLLDHDLFQTFRAMLSQHEGTEVGPLGDPEEVARVDELVHRVVYPVYKSMESAKSQAGTTPFVPRLQRNSIFAARLDAMKRSVLEMWEQNEGVRRNTAQSSGVDDVVGALWPYLDGLCPTWAVPVPSVTTCVEDTRDDEGTAAAGGSLGTSEATLLKLAESFFPSAAPTLCVRAKARGTGMSQVTALSDVALAAIEDFEIMRECEVLPSVHALVYRDQEHGVLRLDAEAVRPLRGLVDVLILKDLEHCTVRVTTHMRFVVLRNVRNCEIVLGPSFACLLEDVHHCPVVAIASSHLVLDHVSHVHLFYSGATPPTASARAAVMAAGDTGRHAADTRSTHHNSEENGIGGAQAASEVHHVTMEPYHVTYPGLSADFAAVGLAQEHMITVHGSFNDYAEGTAGPTAMDGAEEGENGDASRHITKLPVRKQALILGTDATAQDRPNSHAQAAFGTRFVHSHDGVSDVYFFYGELRDKDVTILGIHGGTAIGEGSSPDASTQPHYPLVVILDLVEDVIIRDCSDCTIFVVGAKGSVTVEGCARARIFVLACEFVITRSTDVELYAFITEYACVEECTRVQVCPLFLQCPYFDTILAGMLQQDEEDGERVGALAAYQTRDVGNLNIVLRGPTPANGGDGGGRTVDVVNSTECLIKEWDYCFAGDDEISPEDDPPLIIHVRVPIANLAGGDAGALSSSALLHHGSGGDANDSLNPGLTACLFFRECAEIADFDAQGGFAHVLLGDFVYQEPPQFDDSDSGSPARPPTVHRFHDLVNPSLLRLPGSFALRTQGAGQDDGDAQTRGAAVPVLSDLVVERVCYGVMHFAEAVGTLYIRNCAGPLDIIVCAAERVVMERCENVVVRVACGSFVARGCHQCHVALHVNTQPKYQDCSAMLSSTLNITSSTMEELMEQTGVRDDVNLFNQPLIESSSSSATVGGPHGSGDGIHQYCSERTCGAVRDSRPASSIGNVAGDVPPRFSTEVSPLAAGISPREGLSRAFALLRAPVTVVAPLAGVVVGTDDAAFLESLEGHVTREARRAPVQDGLHSALAFLSECDLAAIGSQSAVAVAAPTPEEAEEEPSLVHPPSQTEEEEGSIASSADGLHDEEHQEEHNELTAPQSDAGRDHADESLSSSSMADDEENEENEEEEEEEEDESSRSGGDSEAPLSAAAASDDDDDEVVPEEEEEARSEEDGEAAEQVAPPAAAADDTPTRQAQPVVTSVGEVVVSATGDAAKSPSPAAVELQNSLSSDSGSSAVVFIKRPQTASSQTPPSTPRAHAAADTAAEAAPPVGEVLSESPSPQEPQLDAAANGVTGDAPGEGSHIEDPPETAEVLAEHSQPLEVAAEREQGTGDNSSSAPSHGNSAVVLFPHGEKGIGVSAADRYGDVNTRSSSEVYRGATEGESARPSSQQEVQVQRGDADEASVTPMSVTSSFHPDRDTLEPSGDAHAAGTLPAEEGGQQHVDAAETPSASEPRAGVVAAPPPQQQQEEEQQEVHAAAAVATPVTGDSLQRAESAGTEKRSPSKAAAPAGEASTPPIYVAARRKNLLRRTDMMATPPAAPVTPGTTTPTRASSSGAPGAEAGAAATSPPVTTPNKVEEVGGAAVESHAKSPSTTAKTITHTHHDPLAPSTGAETATHTGGPAATQGDAGGSVPPVAALAPPAYRTVAEARAARAAAKASLGDEELSQRVANALQRLGMTAVKRG